MHFAKYRPLIASAMLLAATQAQAALTSYNANGEELVFSSVSDVTWTKDGNLLGTLFASQGFNTVVDAIIAASPTISNLPNRYSPSGIYTLSSNDFSSSGTTTWFGAMAFINYLNSTNYAGSNKWRLPFAVTQNNEHNTPSNGSTAGNELSELYYQELGSKAPYDTYGNPQSGYGINNTAAFDNEQSSNYWFGTEYVRTAYDALVFSTADGFQNDMFKTHQIYAWVVSPGQIATVPEPESVALLLVGLSLVGGVVRRRG